VYKIDLQKGIIALTNVRYMYKINKSYNTIKLIMIRNECPNYRNNVSYIQSEPCWPWK